MNRKDGVYNKYFKRILDVVCALVVLLLFWWVFVVIAIMIKCKLGSPIIFHQKRPGKIDPQTGKESIFNLCKFRTMTEERDEEGNLLPDAQRLTKFGRILRATSLDELPELINILRGDMSIVGPRPLLVKYLDYYSDYEHHRHHVRPGLTGLAQVSGRNALTWKNRFDKDREYVENISFMMDIKILLLTVKKVFFHEGIEYTGKETIWDYFESR